MAASSRAIRFLLLLILAALTACSSTPNSSGGLDGTLARLQNWGAPRQSRVANVGSIRSTNDQQSAFLGAVQRGSGSFISSRAPAIERGETRSGEEGYSLNLVNVPIKDAAKSVLGDTLGVNYVIDPKVDGSMTIQTSAPVSQDALIDIFETALAVNGVSLIGRANAYEILPLSDALATTPIVSVPSVSPQGPGIRVQVVELQFIAAEEMNNILEPISREGSILAVDTKRNLMMLAGSGQDLHAMREAISVFDVDWMRGMSVALHPLQTSQPVAIANELDEIFGNTNDAKGRMVRFIPNERLNAILVITSKQRFLSKAANWIEKLDKQARNNEEQLFVYQIQNRPAQEMSEILSAVLSQQNATIEPAQIAPQLTEAEVSNDGGVSLAGSNSEGAAVQVSSVVADIENNALLISTTAREYERIERILKQLDVLPTQVLLEAVIAEVTLNDELNLGMRWFIESGKMDFGFTEVASAVFGAALPGFSWGYATNNVQVTLNALASITDVNVISSPTIMARNNQKAVLQVGDEVPIVTQQSVDTSNDGTIVNSVEMRDTGIILTVTPRVNRSGRVMLDIEQEVSSVVRTTSSGIDSPTIRQRKITTQVTVHDGEALALGGLIQEENSLTRNQVPLLGNIPILGNAFKDKSDKIIRTELIIFIRPRVVRSVQEARSVTSEFRDQLLLESPIDRRRQGKTKRARDINRLVY